MSDEKISAMPPAAALTGAELVPVVQGGANVKATAQNIANLAPAPTVTITKGTTATSGFAVGDLIVNGASNLVDAVADVAVNQVLKSGGVGAKPAYTATPIVTSIQFGTGTALNDYEEGTWTPTDSSGAGLTFTVTRCTYTRIGRAVFLDYRFSYPVTADVSDSAVAGFPFAMGTNQFLTQTALINGGANFGNAIIANGALFFYVFVAAAATKTNANLSNGSVSGALKYSVT
jgi:hypothetical protein